MPHIRHWKDLTLFRPSHTTLHGQHELELWLRRKKRGFGLAGVPDYEEVDRIRIRSRPPAFIEIDTVLREHVGRDGEGNLDGLAGREFDLFIRQKFEPAWHRFRNGVVPVELDRLLAGNRADILNPGARCQRRSSCD